MDDAISKKLILLIRNAITGLALPDNFAITESEALDIYKLAKRHDVANIVYHALVTNNLLDKTSSASKKLEQDYLKSIRRCTRQSSCIEKIERVYEDAGIDYILLKGAEIRKYYPEEWMRTSNDIDILVREEDYEKAIECLAEKLSYKISDSCGYHTGIESDNKVEIEVHNKLNDEYIYEFSVEELTIDTWKNVKLQSGSHGYALSDEYFYLYNVAHMMRHFSDGGCGIRFFLDLWILNKEKYFKANDATYGKKLNLQKASQIEKRREILKKYNLDVFEKKSLELAKAWMEGVSRRDLDAIERFVYAAGTFGTLENRVKLGTGKKSGKIGYLLSRVFVSRDFLKLSYPVIEKHPSLTPIYEVRRWIRLATDKDSRARKETQMLSKEGLLSEDEFLKVKESMGI